MINKEAKNWNNFALGLLVVLVPFLGLPMGIKNAVLIILGFLIMIFSLARLGRNIPAGEFVAPSNVDEVNNENLKNS